MSNVIPAGTSATSEEVTRRSAPLPGRVKAVAWITCITALVAFAELGDAPNWPMAMGIACVVGMVAFICHLILKQR